jgi:hypothetical protein
MLLAQDLFLLSSGFYPLGSIPGLQGQLILKSYYPGPGIVFTYTLLLLLLAS